MHMLKIQSCFESLAQRIVGNLANYNVLGANCSRPCDLTIPFLSKYGFKEQM